MNKTIIVLSDLINGKLYWVREKNYNNTHIGKYESNSPIYGACFWTLGWDIPDELDNVEVLGLVEIIIPEYAEGTEF